jgi:hypothetical protein
MTPWVLSKLPIQLLEKYYFNYYLFIYYYYNILVNKTNKN